MLSLSRGPRSSLAASSPFVFALSVFFSFLGHGLALAAQASPDDAAHGKLTVAVSYFDNNTGKTELGSLAKGLADMLITDLSQVSSLQIVEREKLNQVLGELKLSRSHFIDPKTAQKLGKGLAARFILTGGYVLAQGLMRIDARVFQVETGSVLASEQVEGKEDEFFSLEKDLVDILIKTLEVKLAPPERTKLRSNATQSWVAFTQYAQGLDAADQGHSADAKAAFERALSSDPNYRAARNASERLAALFAHRDQETNAAADDLFRSLDPKAPDLPDKVDAFLIGLEDGKSAQFKRKVALLQWLANQDLLACKVTGGPATGKPTVLIGGVPASGSISYCRQAQEVLSIGLRLAEDPTQWEALPKVCEYFIHRLPNDLSVASYCEHAVLGSLRGYQMQGKEAAQKQWDENKEWERSKLQPGDWRWALLDNEAGMKKLIATYARKNGN